MAYEDEISDVGSFPVSGAIFMSNTATRRECFRQKVFGLPSALANFVKQVKAGMILFLFEFERRKLFGVYRASSDGAMNIVPDAFTSIGKQFPAQVRFTPIWYCSPLSEVEFRDAIRNNYFSAKKFNFGLTEDQVHRLLWLFSSRKLKNRLHQRQLTREFRRPTRKERSSVDDDRSVISEGIEIEPDEGHGFSSANLSEYSRITFERPKRIEDDRSFIGHRVENECKEGGLGWDFSTDGNSVSKRRRIENVGRFLMSGVTKNEHYDDVGPRRGICNEYLGDSSRKVRNVAEGGWCLTGYRIENESRMDNNLEPVISVKYPGNFFNKPRQVAEDVRFRMRDRVGNECSLDDGSGQVISLEHFRKPLDNVGLATENSGFLMNYGVENEHHMASSFKPIMSTDQMGNLLGEVRRPTYDDQFLMNDRIQNEGDMYNGTGPGFSTKHIVKPLGGVGGVRGATDDGRFLMNERLETEHNLETRLGPDIFSEHFGKPSREVAMEIEDKRFLNRDRIETEKNVDNTHEPSISTKYSRYGLDEDRQRAFDGRFRKNFSVEHGHHKDNYLMPVTSTEYTTLHQLKQDSLVYSSKPNLETDRSLLQYQDRYSSMFLRFMEPQKNDFSYLTSHDASVTIAAPYDPDVPSIDCGRRSTSAVERVSGSVNDCSYRGSEENIFFLPKSRSPSYHLEQNGLSRSTDDVSDYVNKVPLPTMSDHYAYFHGKTTDYFPDAVYAEKKELNTSVHDDSLFSESPLVVPFSRKEIYVKENKEPLSCASSSIKTTSFAVDYGYPVVSQDKFEHKIRPCQRDEACSINHCPPSDTNRSCLGMYCHEKNSVNHDNKYYGSSEGTRSDYRSNRTSVFARLTLAPEVHVPEEQENDTHMVCDDYDLDASVDEVMDMLRQSQDHRMKKLKECKLSARQHIDGKITRNKKQTKRNREHDGPSKTMMKRKMDANPATNDDQIIKETRLVDFKRRSEIKKNLDETSTKGSVQVAKGKTSVRNAESRGSVGKQCIRRKLVRPLFGEKESPDEGIGHEGAPKLHHESSLSKGNEVCHEDSARSCENNNESFCNVGWKHDFLPASSVDNNATAQQSSNCEGTKNSENCGALCSHHESDDEKKLAENDAISQVYLKDTTPNTMVGLTIENSMVDDGSSLDHLGMLSYRLNAHDSHPVVGEIMADHQKCRRDEGVSKDVNVQEIFPISCGVSDKLKNGSPLAEFGI